MIIRKASEKDLAGLLDIYNDIILHTTAVYQYETHTLDMRRDWLYTKQKEGFPVFVAEDDDQIAGYSTLGAFRNWQAYKYSVENSVYVASGYRGKGIGGQLLAPLIIAARELNMHTIVAGIDATNEASLRLHIRFGFKEVAYFKQVGYKFNRWLDLKFLQLILETPLHPVGN